MDLTKNRYVLIAGILLFYLFAFSPLSAQTAKDEARIARLSQLYNYWYYYYQLRSIALWDFQRGCDITADIEQLIK